MSEKQSNEKISAEDLSKVLENIISNNHKTMLAFNEAMSKRDDLSVRIGQRTTQILRFGIVSILLISTLMFFLIQSLSKHIDSMAANITQISATMGNMDNSFTVVTQHLNKMDNTMGGINAHVESMSTDIHTVPQMVTIVGNLQTNVENMNFLISTMGGNISALNHNTAGINQKFSVLIQQMGAMSADVNDMSKPMKYFPLPDWK